MVGGGVLEGVGGVKRRVCEQNKVRGRDEEDIGRTKARNNDNSTISTTAAVTTAVTLTAITLAHPQHQQ